jgi:hypothetical protein
LSVRSRKSNLEIGTLIGLRLGEFVPLAIRSNRAPIFFQ